MKPKPVTPEMIEAGRLALSRGLIQGDHQAWIVDAVFRAMDAVRDAQTRARPVSEKVTVLKPV
jgi:hypothetical protein